MVDEAHRTQYGRLAAKMRAAMPRATFVGFTGTPIDKDFKRTTLGVFGELIDSYTIPQSVEDGATVPIYYEARLPELHVEGSRDARPPLRDPLRRGVRGDARRDPASLRKQGAHRGGGQTHRGDRPRHSDHFKKKVRPNGFKAQVVTPSRAAALRYAQHLNDFGLPAYPVITTTHNDGPEF